MKFTELVFKDFLIFAEISHFKSCELFEKHPKIEKFMQLFSNESVNTADPLIRISLGSPYLQKLLKSL